MRTARLPTLCASVATRCQHWQWGGPKWTKVWTGLISSLCHQMSLAGGVPCTVRSYVQGSGVGHGSLYSEVLCREGASLYSDVQCIMGNGHIDPPQNRCWYLVSTGEIQCIMGNGLMGPPHWTDRQTDTTENITFPQLRCREITMVWLRALQVKSLLKYPAKISYWIFYPSVLSFFPVIKSQIQFSNCPTRYFHFIHGFRVQRVRLQRERTTFFIEKKTTFDGIIDVRKVLLQRLITSRF